MVSLTGISSGAVTTFSAVSAGSARISTIQSVCLRTGPTCTSSWIARGASSWLTTCPVAAASTTIEVPRRAPVERLADLPAHLADGEDLLHPGRGVGDEVERTRQRADAPHDRDPGLHPEVLPQRRLGAHLHRRDARVDLTWLEADRRMLEERGQVALAVDLDEQHPLAALGRQECRRRGDGALPDAALAGEEQQAAVEQAGRRAHRRPG